MSSKSKHATGFGIVVLIASVALTGCSDGASGGKMVMNMFKNKNYLRVSLDGQEGKENKLKKAMSGYSRWKIAEPVGTSPTFRFELVDPDKFGRITSTIISIHQEFEGDYSHQAEFTIAPIDNTAEAQLKPDTDYDLGNLPDTVKVMDLRGNEVDNVELTPGLKYQISLTVKADRSETALVFFEAS